MTLYVSVAYYTETYHGSIPNDKVESMLKEAQEKIDSITYNRIVGIGFDNLTEFQKEKVRDAICTQADYIYEHGYNDENDADISSYNVLDISVNVDRNNKETSAKKAHMSERAYDLIKQTGLSCGVL